MAWRRFVPDCLAAVALCFVPSCCLIGDLGLLAKTAMPTFSIGPGTYSEGIQVRILCLTPGAVIRYTTDGSQPDGNSPVYTGTAIRIDNHVAGNDDPDPNDNHKPLATVSMTLKAFAVGTGLAPSETASSDYTIDKVDSTFNIAFDAPPAAGGDKHKLDVYHPHGQSSTKVLFFIHGGAWRQGDKNIYLELGNTFAGYYGLTTVITNYELSAEPWNAVHPAHVQDAAKAFAWVHDHIAEYGGDPNQIYVFGHSAGAHTASLLATDSRYLEAHGLGTGDIRGVISMSGPYDLYDLVEHPDNPLGMTTVEVTVSRLMINKAFGGYDQAILDAASPASFVTASRPPFHIVHAWDDMAGLNQEATNFCQQLTSVGGPFVDILQLQESDIPPEILAIDFGGYFDGHYEEVYAINTRNWNSLSTTTVVDFIQAH